MSHKYQFRVRQRSGLYPPVPRALPEIATRILLGESYDIELRYCTEDESYDSRAKKDWKDWREFPEVLSFIETVQSSPKFRLLSNEMQGMIPIEEIRLVHEYLKLAESDKPLVFNHEIRQWQRTPEFFETMARLSQSEEYQNDKQPDNHAQLFGQSAVPSKTYLRLDQMVMYLVGNPDDFETGLRFVRSFYDVLLRHLKENVQIHFPKLGTFHLKEKKGYTRDFIQRKEKLFGGHWWPRYMMKLKKEGATRNRVEVPARMMLYFRPAKNLKACLKHEGDSDLIQLKHFSGERNASLHALIWSQQKGKLSVRRMFAQKVATQSGLSLVQCAALLNRWLTLVGRCLAQDNLVETDEFGSFFTEWHQSYETTGANGERRTIEKHRRAYFVLSQQLQEKHELIASS